jgi:alpha-tubulin suppressor-like RCC1 family protein
MSLSGVTGIAAGTQHGLALLANGSVVAWGGNQYGQLGDGSTTNRLTPVPVSGLSGVVAIAAGASHSVALTSDGQVWAWGLNTSYQLGDGTTTQRNQPVRVDGLFGIVAIGAGSGSLHSLAVRADGSVLAWGSNTYGQLGDGTTVVRATPVLVHGLTTVVAVGTMRDISTAILANGTLWAWGQAGAVGDGSLVAEANRMEPVQLGISGITSVSSSNGSSAGHSLALANDGVVWAWNAGWLGQIGDGTTNYRSRPVKVTEPGFAKKVATPTFSHLSPQYPSPIAVTLLTATTGATIRYTTDGTEPSATSTLYSTPVSIAQNATLKAKAFKSGLADSNTEVMTYTILAANPTFNPVGGTYSTPQDITISSTTAGATIRYTTDNTDPTTASPAYSTPIALSANTTIKAKAFHGAMGTSQTSLASYSFNFPTGGQPTFSPVPGTFVGSVAVTLSGPGGATLRYTLDGSDPTTASPSYSSPLTFTATTTLKAKSFQAGQAPSATTTGTYTIELVAPTLSPTGGALTPGQAITLNHADPSVTIRYTINGVDPGPTDAAAAPGSTVTPYSNLTLKARAYKTGNNPSAVTSGTFTLSGTPGGAGAIAAGATHALVAKPDGSVWAWGANGSGTLGDGTNTNGLTPTLISSLSGITSLGGGGGHSVARKSDGTPWTTGDNSSGQIGDGTSNSRNTFGGLAKPGGVNVVAVASGMNFTVALGSDGRVWAWGNNGSGQLGNGNNANQSSPVLVSGLTNVQAIAAGRSHALAVTTAGAVWAWGTGNEGQLGNGGTANSNVPVQVTTVGLSNLSGVVSVAGGVNLSLARKSDGTVWAWGRNAEGELGSGSISSNRTRADQVVQLAQVRALAAGDWHALAVRNDGSVWGWGNGAYGQLGNNSGADQPTPVQANGISGIDSVAGGGYFSVALGLDGSIWSWGDNLYGQLGDGTTLSRSAPARVADAGFTWRRAAVVRAFTRRLVAAPERHPDVRDPGASINYNQRRDPTPADASVASGGTVWVDISLTLKARAYKSGWTASNVAAANYTLNLPPPTATVATGTYHVPQTVSFSHAASGAVLRYTLGGATVTSGSPIVPGTLAIGETTTVNVAAFLGTTVPGASGTSVSAQASFGYTMKVGKPSHSLGGATPSGGLGLGVSTVTPGATLRFSLGGQGLISGSSALVPTSGLEINRSTTLRTKGWHLGAWETSVPASSSHFLSHGTATTPGFSLGAVTSAGRFLSISSPTAGSVIRYTLDGTDPTPQSPQYHGPIRVSPGMGFRARAFGIDYTPSAPTTVFSTGAWGLTESGEPAEPPTFNPPGGSYATARAITLTSATPGATIRYTTDGTTPTTSSASVASGGTVSVTRGVPLKAIAVASGMSESRVARADYQITGAVVAGVRDTYNNVQSAIALKTDGTLWGWGNNAYGELGIGAGGIQTTPVQASITNVKAVALGMSHGLAVKTDGTVWAWGQNGSGQLGDGTTTAHLTPAVVPGLSQVVSVAAGAATSYALTSSGAVYSWGLNNNGQLGNAGTDPQRTTPGLVSLTDAVSLAAGAYHVVALKKDGTVWAWGTTPTARWVTARHQPDRAVRYRKSPA